MGFIGAALAGTISGANYQCRDPPTFGVRCEGRGSRLVMALLRLGIVMWGIYEILGRL